MTSISQFKMPDPAMGKAPAPASKSDTDDGGVFSRAFNDEASKAPKNIQDHPTKAAARDDTGSEEPKARKDPDAEPAEQSNANEGDTTPSAEEIIVLAESRSEMPASKSTLGATSSGEAANSDALKNGLQMTGEAELDLNTAEGAALETSTSFKLDGKSVLASTTALATTPQVTGAQSVETLMKADPIPQANAPSVNVEVATAGSQPIAPNSVQTQAPIISTQRPDWIANVSASIIDASDMAAEAMELTLTPENLGKIQIRMEIKDGVTSVTIVTQNEDAARLFNETKNQLSEMLARSGLDLAQHDAHANSERDFGRIASAQGAAQEEQETNLNQATSATIPTSLVDLVA